MSSSFFVLLCLSASLPLLAAPPLCSRSLTSSYERSAHVDGARLASAPLYRRPCLSASPPLFSASASSCCPSPLLAVPHPVPIKLAALGTLTDPCDAIPLVFLCLCLSASPPLAARQRLRTLLCLSLANAFRFLISHLSSLFVFVFVFVFICLVLLLFLLLFLSASCSPSRIPVLVPLLLPGCAHLVLVCACVCVCPWPRAAFHFPSSLLLCFPAQIECGGGARFDRTERLLPPPLLPSSPPSPPQALFSERVVPLPAALQTRNTHTRARHGA